MAANPVGDNAALDAVPSAGESDRVAAWARPAGSRGLLVVPIKALVTREGELKRNDLDAMGARRGNGSIVAATKRWSALCHS